MNGFARRLAVGATALALVFTSACGSDDDNGGSDGNGAGLEKITYMAGLNMLGRESFIYVAMEKNYFKDAGLEVTIKPGKGTEANLKMLQAGQVDYAVVDITGALISYGKGSYRDFTVVSAIQQRNLAALMSLEGGKVNGPKDLEGKKIGYIPGGVTPMLFNTYANLVGVNPKTVKWVNMPIEAMPAALAAGSIDVATQFVVAKPFVENVAKPKKAIVMPFSDVLVDLYGNGVAVSKNRAKDKADQVKRFNEAMLRGLAYAIDHPEEAGKIYSKYQKTQPAPVASAEMKLMIPYVKSGITGGQVGALDRARMVRNIAILQGAGVIPSAFQPQDIISFDLVGKS